MRGRCLEIQGIEQVTMPTAERTEKLYRKLLDAALEQPAPTVELKLAISKVLDAIEHNLRAK